MLFRSGSPTATLLRLHPSHEAYRGKRAPCGYPTYFWYPPLQVLVADDGSGSETVQVVARWREHLGERLLHCWQPDEGFRLSAARNRAIREARGDLLVFVDGDCLLRPDFVLAHQRLAEPGFATAGNRVLLSERLTAQVEAGDCNPLDWNPWQWLQAWRRDDINNVLGLLRLPGRWWRHPKGFVFSELLGT